MIKSVPLGFLSAPIVDVDALVPVCLNCNLNPLFPYVSPLYDFGIQIPFFL